MAVGRLQAATPTLTGIQAHQGLAGQTVSLRPLGLVSAVLPTLVMAVLATGCTSLPARKPLAIDCTQPTARCHEGRFGLTFRIERGGQTEADAINGTWRWESVSGRNMAGPDTTEGATQSNLRPDRAHLELSNVLGIKLANVEQSPRLLLLTDGKGRQYRARNWDDLFTTLFELQLPGDSIAAWMASGANPQQPPATQAEGWRTEAGQRRLRLQWQGPEGHIRLDLIPDAPAP